jgi:hypothetical protein
MLEAVRVDPFPQPVTMAKNAGNSSAGLAGNMSLPTTCPKNVSQKSRNSDISR